MAGLEGKEDLPDRRRCPGDGSSGWPSPAPCSTARGWCSSTSRPAASIRISRRRFWSADRRHGGGGRDRPRDHALPRRGRALQPHRADARRPAGGARHGRGAQGGLRRPRASSRSPAPRSVEAQERARGAAVGARGLACSARGSTSSWPTPRTGARGSRSSSRATGNGPVAVERIVPSLEDVFIHTVEPRTRLARRADGAGVTEDLGGRGQGAAAGRARSARA